MTNRKINKLIKQNTNQKLIQELIVLRKDIEILQNGIEVTKTQITIDDKMLLMASNGKMMDYNRVLLDLVENTPINNNYNKEQLKSYLMNKIILQSYIDQLSEQRKKEETILLQLKQK